MGNCDAIMKNIFESHNSLNWRYEEDEEEKNSQNQKSEVFFRNKTNEDDQEIYNLVVPWKKLNNKFNLNYQSKKESKAQNKKLNDVQWYWNSADDPFKSQKWQKYSLSDTKIIEEGYKKHKEIIEIDSYLINTVNLFQVNKRTSNVRPIKREVQKSSIRQDRFNIKLPSPITVEDENSDFDILKDLDELTNSDGFNYLFHEFLAFAKGKRSENAACNFYNKFIEILEEGIIAHCMYTNQLEIELNKAKVMIQKLRELVKLKNFSMIQLQIIHMYTEESFLYKEINKCLRKENLQNFKNLGFYSHFLNKILSNCMEKFKFKENVVFRGVQLDPSEIEEYEKIFKSDYPVFRCNYFLSASKDINVAKIYGNVIFHIDFFDSFGIDISKISNIPDEEEVLMQLGSLFQIKGFKKEENEIEIFLVKIDNKKSLKSSRPSEMIFKKFSLDLHENNPNYGGCNKRLQKELLELLHENDNNLKEAGFLINIVNDNLFQWEVFLMGPKSTLYEEGIFLLDLLIPLDYPYKPPKISFKTQILHPNISAETGEICLDIVKDQWIPFH